MPNPSGCELLEVITGLCTLTTVDLGLGILLWFVTDVEQPVLSTCVDRWSVLSMFLAGVTAPALRGRTDRWVMDLPRLLASVPLQLG